MPDPFHGRGEMVLSCETCRQCLPLGIVHHGDADDDMVLLARRIAAEAPKMLDEVGRFIALHNGHEWLPVAIMPIERFERIS